MTRDQPDRGHPAAGRNPLLPLDIHMPDPEARSMPDGRLYLYGSLDDSEDHYCSGSYRVASTTDLTTWTVHDVAFRADQVPWAPASTEALPSFLDGVSSYKELPDHVVALLPPGATEAPFAEFAEAVRAETERRRPTTPLLYAPDAIERNGRYHLYFCLSDGSEGVAVADRPEGPFTDPVRLPVDGIDPSVFIDDDGQAYLYWGQFRASGARLHTDMVTIDVDSIRPDLVTERDHHFHEGASMRKRNGVYYLVFADTSRGRPTCLGYATSTGPLGPFTYRGVIIDNAEGDPEAWNNHGSIEEFGGRWLVFYHRNSRKAHSMRRVCAEPIEFDDAGLIPEVPMTSQGPGPPFVAGERIPAYTACRLTGGAFIAPHSDTEAVFGLGAGASATFRSVDVGPGVESVEVAAEGGGSLDVLIGGEFVGRLDAAAGHGVISVPDGTHEVEIVGGRSSDLVLVHLVFR